MKLHGEEVKVGDRVWHLYQGWGEVDDIEEGHTNYPICVRWKEGDECFTKDGKADIDAETPTLFWQPIEFEIPKKPRPKEKAWQWICRDGDKYWISYLCFGSKEDVLERIPNTEPIEPYLPSEIERNR